MTLKEKALQIARTAHLGQTDKSGHPYIRHPIAVAFAFQDEIHIAVALLHDVVEDTSITLQALREEGFPEDIIEAVDAITRRSGENYADYLNRVKENPIARAVKLQDLEHNMWLERIPFLTEEDYSRLERYKQYHQFLANQNHLNQG